MNPAVPADSTPAATDALTWERSAFLHERAAPPPDAPLGGEELADAEERAARWQLGMLADDAFFQERLALVGLDRASFVRILADGAPRARPDAPDALGWLAFLDAARGGEHQHDDDEPLPGMDALPFAGFIVPTLRHAAARLRSGVREMRERRGLNADPASAAVRAEQLRALLRRLGPQCTQMLTLELHVARVMGELRGETPEERFRFFSAEYLARPEVRHGLLHEYAVLARLMATMVDRWVANTLEFLERLEDDRAELARVFGGDPGVLVEMKTGTSDSHRGGHTVAHVRFSGGLRLVYKPVALAVDARFQALVGMLNGLGLRHPHRTLAVLDRGTYGWMEWVDAAPCASADEVARFYWRQGSHLALLHLLRATDFHYENLIAAGEHPVLVDLEGLLHHDLADGGGATAAEETVRVLRNSVLRLALLPVISRGADGSIGADLSALGGEGGQALAGAAADVAEALTDRMRVIRADGVTSDARNLPTLDGATPRFAEYEEDVVRGFLETYTLIAARRDEMAGELRGFAGVQVRNILRNTAHYSLFLREGNHPDYLRDALERDALLDRLWAEATVRPAIARAVPAELADLRLGDVPVFAARPGERHLWDSRGARIPDFFPRASLDVALEQLAEMSDAERDRQAYLIRLAVASVTPPRPRPPAEGEPPAERDALLAGAVAAGEWLMARAVLGADDAAWITLAIQPDAVKPDSTRRVIAAAESHLYDGGSGITLFLAYLADATGRGDFRELAERGLRAARAEMHRPGAVGTAMTGAFLGHGSYLYLLIHLAALWNRPALLDEALASLAGVEALVAGDTHLDLLSGVAGCAVVCLHLHRATGDARALRLAARCGERLLEAASPRDGGVAWVTASSPTPFAGLAHGAAGIGWALLELGAATGDPRFRDAARGAFAWERAAFRPGGGEWSHDQVAWCHGAPSIALGRALAAPLLDDAGFADEIGRGVDAVLALGMREDPCLCHGTLGNADILLACADASGRPDLRDTALRWGAAVARAVADDAARPGILPAFARAPGMMCGAAGVGMGLLRLYDPVAVPSVPSLGAPRARPASHDMENR